MQKLLHFLWICNQINRKRSNIYRDVLLASLGFLASIETAQCLTFPLKKGKRDKPFEPAFAIGEERFRE
jgi:hypothetical protein